MCLARRARAPAQTDNLHVDRPCRDRVVVAMHGVENLLARVNPARLCAQEMQQAELRRAQLHRFVVHHHRMTPRMDHDVVDLDANRPRSPILVVVRRSARVAQHRADAGQQARCG